MSRMRNIALLRSLILDSLRRAINIRLLRSYTIRTFQIASYLFDDSLFSREHGGQHLEGVVDGAVGFF